MAAPFIQDDLHLTDKQLGIVFGAFTFAYAALEMPAGWLADRFGPRLMLARVVIWWSIMTALTGWVGGFASLLAIRFLFGVGEAGTFPGISRVYSRWLPVRAHGYAFGLAVMTALLCGAVAQKLTAALLGVMSWRWIFPLYAMVGVVWAVVWYLWFRDDPHHHPAVNEAELRVIRTHPPSPHPPVPSREMLRSRSLIALCGMYFGIIYGWYFFLTWLPNYLMKARGFDLKAAGWLAMWPLLCMAAGVAFGGWLSDVLTRRWGSRSGRRTPGMIGFLFSDEEEDGVDSKADQAADEGSIQANELEISANGCFKFAGHLLGVPSLDCGADEFSNERFCAEDCGEDLLGNVFVCVIAHGRIVHQFAGR